MSRKFQYCTLECSGAIWYVQLCFMILGTTRQRQWKTQQSSRYKSAVTCCSTKSTASSWTVKTAERTPGTYFTSIYSFRKQFSWKLWKKCSGKLYNYTTYVACRGGAKIGMGRSKLRSRYLHYNEILLNVWYAVAKAARQFGHAM